MLLVTSSIHFQADSPINNVKTCDFCAFAYTHVYLFDYHLRIMIIRFGSSIAISNTLINGQTYKYTDLLRHTYIRTHAFRLLIFAFAVIIALCLYILWMAKAHMHPIPTCIHMYISVEITQVKRCTHLCEFLWLSSIFCLLSNLFVFIFLAYFLLIINMSICFSFNESNSRHNSYFVCH